MAQKAKTNKGALKRFRANGAGTLLKRRRSNRNHILTKNSQDQKRRLRCHSGSVNKHKLAGIMKLLKSKLVKRSNKKRVEDVKS